MVQPKAVFPIPSAFDIALVSLTSTFDEGGLRKLGEALKKYRDSIIVL